MSDFNFKVGDLVYCSAYSASVCQIKNTENSYEVVSLRSNQSIIDFFDCGFDFADGKQEIKFVGIEDSLCLLCHATQENYELLSKLYPNVEFEPPPKRKEPIDVITAMLEGGYNEVCLKAPIVGYEIVGNPTHARNACHAVKIFKPYNLKKGKYIVDFIDGKCVLEDGEVVVED